MSFFKNEHGTVLLESLTAIILIVTVILLILTIAYFAFAKVTVKTTAYNALICAAESQPRSVCESKAKQIIESRLPFGSLNRLKLKNSRRRYRVDTSWTLFADHRIHYSKSLRY